MQNVKFILGIALSLTALSVQAEKDDPASTYSYPPTLTAGKDYVGISQKNLKQKEAATSPQPTAVSDDTPYKTPLSAYNNGGHFSE